MKRKLALDKMYMRRRKAPLGFFADQFVFVSSRLS